MIKAFRKPLLLYVTILFSSILLGCFVTGSHQKIINVSVAFVLISTLISLFLFMKWMFKDFKNTDKNVFISFGKMLLAFVLCIIIEVISMALFIHMSINRNIHFWLLFNSLFSLTNSSISLMQLLSSLALLSFIITCILIAYVVVTRNATRKRIVRILKAVGAILGYFVIFSIIGAAISEMVGFETGLLVSSIFVGFITLIFIEKERKRQLDIKISVEDTLID